MARFVRTGYCESCGLEYIVTGTGANPDNETQQALSLECSCGGKIRVHVPGSADRAQLRVEPRSE
jgi:hypothetical protein